MNWLRKALSGEPSKARPNQQTMHVEAFTKGHQDAGSIPAASTRYRLSHQATARDNQRQNPCLGKGFGVSGELLPHQSD